MKVANEFIYTFIFNRCRICFHFNSIGASGKVTCGGCCKLCQGVISVSGNHVNGISNLDISLKDLKCDGKIARQYVTGIQREGIKKDGRAIIFSVQFYYVNFIDFD